MGSSAVFVLSLLLPASRYSNLASVLRSPREGVGQPNIFGMRMAVCNGHKLV